MKLYRTDLNKNLYHLIWEDMILHNIKINPDDIKHHKKEIKELRRIIKDLSIAKECLDSIKKVFSIYHWAYHDSKLQIDKATVKNLRKERDRIEKEYNTLYEKGNRLFYYLEDSFTGLGDTTLKIINKYRLEDLYV